MLFITKHKPRIGIYVIFYLQNGCIITLKFGPIVGSDILQFSSNNMASWQMKLLREVNIRQTLQNLDFYIASKVFWCEYFVGNLNCCDYLKYNLALNFTWKRKHWYQRWFKMTIVIWLESDRIVFIAFSKKLYMKNRYHKHWFILSLK